MVVDIDPTSYYEYMKWHNRMTGNGSVPFDEIHSSDLKYLASMFQELKPGETYEPKAGDFQRPEKPSKPFMDKDTMTPKEMKAAVLNFRGIGTERFLTPKQDKLKLGACGEHRRHAASVCFRRYAQQHCVYKRRLQRNDHPGHNGKVSP